MAACDSRQLSQAQREAAYQQQRTGVPQALRPFSGNPTLENLLDYLNRELVPAVQRTRGAVNDVYLQVADQAPSANPLSYYFAENTAASDPTVGRIKLNASPQDTATVIRVSQSNGRLQDVTPWLDVMSGGPTTPLGTVTLMDVINPGRFLRFDLNTMTDQGAYWDLGVTIIEGSHDDPFVEGEAVTLGFISGVSAAGSTVPVGSLSPIATDTFLGNISGSAAAPAAVPLANVDSTSIVYDGTSHTFQRAALTGAIASTQNSNATVFAGIRDNGSAENDRTNLNFVSSTSVTIAVTDDAGNDELEVSPQRAALTGAVSASANSNATLFSGILDNGAAETDRTNLNFVSTTGASITLAITDDSGNDELEVSATYVGSTSNINLTALTGAQGVIDISALQCGGSVTVESVSANYTVDGFTAKTDGFWFWFIDRRQSGTAVGTFSEDDGATTTSIRNANEVETVVDVAGRVLLYYFNNRWRALPAPDIFKRAANTFTAANVFSGSVAHGAQVTFTGLISPSAIGSNQNDYSPTGWATANIVRLSTSGGSTRDINGAAAGSSGELKWLVNLGPDTIRLQHENAGSSAANRFLLVSGTTFNLSTNGVVGILYDTSSSRWRPVNQFGA